MWGITLIVASLLFNGVFLPTSGTVLKYEDYKGCQVPIKADGRGGEYRWVKDVPWDNFTIEEKFDFARIGGGLLSDKDIQEIKQKYGEK